MFGKYFKRGLTLLLGLAMLFTAAACGGGEEPPESSQPEDTYVPITDFTDGIFAKESSQTLLFKSDSAVLDQFLNDYFARHVGYPEGTQIPALDVGDGGTAWKEWEAQSLMWYNSINGLDTNRQEKLRSWLDIIPVDRFGYVWSSKDDTSTPMSGHSYANFDQGWPFPSMESMGNRGYGWGTNCNVKAGEPGWAVRADGYATNGQLTYSGGAYRLVATSAYPGSGEELYFEVSGVQDGYTFYAPFVEFCLRIDNNSAQVIDDIYLQWTTSDGVSHEVSYADYGTQEKDFNQSGFYAKLYFAMFASEEWGQRENLYRPEDADAPTVESMRLVIRPKTGQSLNYVNFTLDYFRTDFDTRCVQNNAIYLDAVAEYYRYTGDDDYLAQKLETCRRIFQFYLTYCGGESGLIHQDNFVGHDGVPLPGHGISSGYFDIVSLPSVDFYFNVYFYKAVQSMEYLEQMAAAAGIEAGEVSVLTPDMQDSETYDQTAESLTDLAETCKAEISDYFWNEEKGRFAEGFNDWDGDLACYVSADMPDQGKMQELASRGEEFDLGFLAFNLEAVSAGVAGEEQAEQILSWATGERVIAGDDATGEDLYFFDCAPRFNTVNNDYWFYCGVATDDNYPFTEQVQNGGSCLWISYYDLLARAEVYGADSAYGRLSEIAGWYADVQTAYNDAISRGADVTAKEFYRAYYYDLARSSSSSYNVFNETYNPEHITLQGAVNGRDTAGGLGLDAEFLENAVLYAAVPQVFLGMGSDDYRTLNFAPDLPEGLSYFKLENLYYQGWQYDVCAGSNYLRISDSREVSLGSGKTGLSVTVSFAVPDQEYRVYVNGRMVESAEQNGRVYVTVPFGDTFVKIG